MKMNHKSPRINLNDDLNFNDEKKGKGSCLLGEEQG